MRIREKNKNEPFSFQVDFFGETNKGITVTPYEDEFILNGADEKNAAVKFITMTSAKLTEIEELLMDFFFMDMSPDYRNLNTEQYVIEEFKPETLFVKENGDFVLWGSCGVMFGDEGFALVVGSHFEVAKQSEYLRRKKP